MRDIRMGEMTAGDAEGVQKSRRTKVIMITGYASSGKWFGDVDFIAKQGKSDEP